MDLEENKVVPDTSAPSTASITQKNKEKKYAFYRKPSLKKKGPEVKQTKTSIKRLLIANPLLKYEQEGIELPILEKPLSSELESLPEIPKPTSNANKGTTLKRSKFTSTVTSKSSNKVVVNSRFITCERSSSQIDPSKQLNTRNGTTKRRSISADHFERTKGSSKTHAPKDKKPPKVTRSTESLGDSMALWKVGQSHEISPIAERSMETSFEFKTPSAYERRSRISTPLSTASNRRSFYRPTTTLPSLLDLQKRLSIWLVKRGKSVAALHNLKFFEKTQPVDEENKENVEGNGIFDRGSYESLCIPSNDGEEVERQQLNTPNIEAIAKAALLDLQKLVQEGYPVNQCDGWLSLIKEKHPQLTKEPEYWECRAAIEESRGDISSAVECYRTAIVQGAEVKEVDKSLDVLLKKFSLLDINSEYVESEKMTKQRARIIRDARNVFKSSIIKFAVQEKKMKKDKETRLVATPVRRSTRLSRSGFTSSTDVKLCSSLSELDSPERSKVHFHTNRAFN